MHTCGWLTATLLIPSPHVLRSPGRSVHRTCAVLLKHQKKFQLSSCTPVHCTTSTSTACPPRRMRRQGRCSPYRLALANVYAMLRPVLATHALIHQLTSGSVQGVQAGSQLAASFMAGGVHACMSCVLQTPSASGTAGAVLTRRRCVRACCVCRPAWWPEALERGA